MGREIKFRAWDSENNCKKLSIGKLELFDDMLAFRFDHFDQDPENIIFEQFTGLRDKNGTNEELYCGDLMSCGCGNHPIEWDNVFTGYVVNVGDDQYPLHQYIYDFKAKKTGNIHENPELLEHAN